VPGLHKRRGEDPPEVASAAGDKHPHAAYYLLKR
jgi:hypothetical protein